VPSAPQPCGGEEVVPEADQPGTEVADLVGRGLSNPEIAAELFISRKAVEYHLGNIYAKYGIHSREQPRRLVAQSREPSTV